MTTSAPIAFSSTSSVPAAPASGPALRGAAGVIAGAQERIAAAGGVHIGDLVSWNGEGIDVEREEVRRIFATIGFESLVPRLVPASALTRAVSETRRPEGLRVSPFRAPNTDTPIAYGIYKVSGAGESGDAHQCGARVRVEMKTDTVVATPPEGGVVIDECIALAEQIAARANHLVTHAETRDVGAAMVAAVKRLDGVGLRDRGGFYLLAPERCGAWKTLKPELERIGVRPIRIEMHDAPDNVQVAAAAAEGALEEDIRELLADLERAAGPEGMRRSAIARRVEQCSQLRAKAQLFRGVLEGAVDEIAKRCIILGQAFEEALAEHTGTPTPTPAQKPGIFAPPPVIDEE